MWVIGIAIYITEVAMWVIGIAIRMTETVIWVTGITTLIMQSDDNMTRLSGFADKPVRLPLRMRMIT